MIISDKLEDTDTEVSCRSTPTPIPQCKNCLTSHTPLWRRDKDGSMLCNACGLFHKMHGRARPISLKTDQIRHRNRKKKAISVMKIRPEPLLPHGQLISLSSDINCSTTTTIPVSDIPWISKGAPIRNPSPRQRPHHNNLQDEEFVIKLKTRVNELESITRLYKNHITRLEQRCQILESKLYELVYH